MKIYFTASTADFKTYKDTYFAIREFLIEQGHILVRDWLPKTSHRIDSGALDVEDIKEIYKICIQAIAEADLVIIEDTVSNFSTGHQITIALQRQKPTLVLWKGRKHRHFKKMFIHGIESDYLEVVEYKDDGFKTAITSFINKYENVYQKNRFHLVLNSIERNYLDWAQFNTGKSRTKLIRDAIQKILATDESYSRYLEGKIKS